MAPFKTLFTLFSMIMVANSSPTLNKRQLVTCAGVGAICRVDHNVIRNETGYDVS